MDEIRKLRKFIGSQNLYTGIRMTAGALIPAFILYKLDLLSGMMAIPLGAMFTGLTDSPGPLHHRVNSLAASLVFNFVVIVIAGFLHAWWPLVIVAIVVFGMFFSLIAIYGNRVSSIGLVALIVFIFNIDGHLASHNTFREALLFTVGGVWYCVLSLSLHTLRPYVYIQQLLGECLIQTSNYMNAKAAFYLKDANYGELNTELLTYQISLQQSHDDLREMLFKTRRIVSESTVKGRVMISIFLDSVDLLERIMTSQYDYKTLHEKFDNTNILQTLATQIKTLAAELHEIGLALQSGSPSFSITNVDDLQRRSMDEYITLRKANLNANTIEDFIALRQILYSLQDITERIKRLHVSTRFDKKTSKEYKSDVEIEKFITHREIDPKILVENLSLKSSNFRHAVRVTVGLLAGYIISLFFPIGHSYWILLTIATIIKPAYSITRQRNIHRLSGTVVGAIIGFGLLYFVKDNTVLFIVTVIAMIVAYSLIKVNYFVSSAAITLYVLVSLTFLSPGNFKHALNDRVIDTLIGSVIAWIVAFFVLPVWERGQIDTAIAEALDTNRKYFNIVAQAFTGKPADNTIFKLLRKNAFVAMANLSDIFQRMLSEPKNQQQHMEHYHQFVASTHMLTSYIASLSYYAQSNANKYASEDFIPLMNQVDKQFQMAQDVVEHHETIKASQIKPALPLSKKVQQLLALRQQELNDGKMESETTVRKTLSDLKTINNQFELISTITVDEIRILEKLAGE